MKIANILTMIIGANSTHLSAYNSLQLDPKDSMTLA